MSDENDAILRAQEKWCEKHGDYTHKMMSREIIRLVVVIESKDKRISELEAELKASAKTVHEQAGLISDLREELRDARMKVWEEAAEMAVRTETGR